MASKEFLCYVAVLNCRLCDYNFPSRLLTSSHSDKPIQEGAGKITSERKFYVIHQKLSIEFLT